MDARGLLARMPLALSAAPALPWPAAAPPLPAAAARQEPAQPAPAPAHAAPEGARASAWIDAQDGWFDISRFLEHPAGFVPLVAPITEPAFGYGAFAGALFLDPREEAGAEGWARPNMTAVGGLLTEDGSDGLFAGNSSLWDGGDLQTLFAAGNLGLELSLYGAAQDSASSGDALDYHLEVDAILGEVRRRIGESDFWGGLRFTYARAETEFDDSTSEDAGVDAGDDAVTLAGPSLALRYDSLDNVFTPTRGLLSDTSATFYDDLFGGSRDFQLFQQVLIHHWTLVDDLFLGARGQFDASFGDVPFYSRPYVQLRGVPALRYQGEQALSAEAELRWQFHPRVGVVGFGGAGLAWNAGEGSDGEQDAWSLGTGARYLLSRQFGLLVGLDVARGPEDFAVYVQFGNAWFRP